jgi:2-amino-4-hydroxy-6-hydroxymethyldihydropteridine diphosphokinase
VNTAYLALGSNLGDRVALLRGALVSLRRGDAVRVTAESAVYETAPVGGPEQPDYLNLVVAVETNLTPEALLERCLGIEVEHGRVRRERWGARTLDLDLLCYGAVELKTDRLTLPHPRMAERAFVLVPLAEIAPELKIGDSKAGALAAKIDRSGLRKLGSLTEAGADRGAVRVRGESCGPALPSNHGAQG